MRYRATFDRRGISARVGAGGRSTAASALIERRSGHIVVRRVDVRATRAGWKTQALAHELAHVVLADRFDTDALPRWLDEGMAILADPAEKRRGHSRGVRRAMATGSYFRLPELLSLSDYPPASRWATFYDQSAALVEYLVARQGHERFVEFVEISLEHGYDHALRQVYDVGMAQLERQWRAALARPGSTSMAKEPAPSTEGNVEGES